MNDHNHDRFFPRDIHAGMTPKELEASRKELQYILDNPDKVIVVAGDTYDTIPRKKGG